MIVSLIRLKESEAGTFGVLYIRGGNHRPVYTLELPWRDNERGESRIKPGTYRCVPHGWNNENLKFKKTWRLENVPGRSAILLHAGNTIKDTDGCVLVGLGSMEHMVLSSKDAMRFLHDTIGNNEFTLEVGDYFDD